MLGQAPWARLSPSGPAVLLLALCAVLTTQDICNSARDGDLTAPTLFLNTSSAQEGESFSLRCTIDGHSAPTRIVFCKDRMEAHSLKGQLGNLIYTITLKVTQGSEGTYMCGYKLKDDSNRVRSSALSAGRILDVPGSVTASTAWPSSPGSAMPLEVWILRSALSLLLLLSAPIITLLLERWSHGASRARQPGDVPVPMVL